MDELRRTCDRALASHGVVTLDLGAVGFIDRAGLALFRELEGRTVRVTNCSPFVAEQLRGDRGMLSSASAVALRRAPRDLASGFQGGEPALLV